MEIFKRSWLVKFAKIKPPQKLPRIVVYSTFDGPKVLVITRFHCLNEVPFVEHQVWDSPRSRKKWPSEQSQLTQCNIVQYFYQLTKNRAFNGGAILKTTLTLSNSNKLNMCNVKLIKAFYLYPDGVKLTGWIARGATWLGWGVEMMSSGPGVTNFWWRCQIKPLLTLSSSDKINMCNKS